MEYYIYLDLFFLLNFAMNTLCLKSVSFLMRRQCSWKKLFLGAVSGALGNIIVIVAGFSIPGMSLWMAVGMCHITFGLEKSRGDRIIPFVLLFLAFCVEGIISWSRYRWMILFIPIICNRIGKEKRKREQAMKVTLCFHGRKKVLKGFYDSGNRLTEPMTGKMVHIVCYEDVKELLPESYRQVAEQYLETEYFEDTKVTELQMYEFTFLSYHSIGKENGQLLGIRMNWAEFENCAGKKTEERVVIGLAKQQLFVRGQDQIIVNGRLEL